MQKTTTIYDKEKKNINSITFSPCFNSCVFINIDNDFGNTIFDVLLISLYNEMPLY
jgi:hypothetical protein